MGLFTSKDHLFNYLEEVVVDRNFLNLHKHIKNFEFDQRAKTSDHRNPFIYESIDYDFFINKKRVRFSCTKKTLKGYESYYKYFETHMMTKSEKDIYLGLPHPTDIKETRIFPFRILELRSIVLIKEKYGNKLRERFIDAAKSHYLWIEYKNNKQWVEELVKEFDKTASKLIKETLKNSNLLNKAKVK